jgi:hypothetical protein
MKNNITAKRIMKDRGIILVIEIVRRNEIAPRTVNKIAKNTLYFITV